MSAEPVETFMQRQLRKKAEKEAAARPALASGTTWRPPTINADAGSRRGAAWAAKKLEATCIDLAAAPEGGRNHALNAAAYSLGRLTPAWLSRDDIEAGLLDAARRSGLDDRESRLTITSGLDSGQKEPRDPPTGADDEDPWEVFGVTAPKPQPKVEAQGQAAVEGPAEPWGEPMPLEMPRPEFPVDALGPLEPTVVALAEHLQTPVDLVAMMTLAAISATVRGRVRLTVRDTWTEPLNLYVLVLAGAGETKSPVLGHVARGLRAIEKADQDAAKAEVHRYQQQKRLLEGRLAKAEKAAIAASPETQWSAEGDADEARRILDELEPVTMPRYLAGDVTAEALVRLLAEQGGAMASLTAEGGLFDTLAGGRYSGGMANLDAVLQAHDGREPILVDRKGSDPLRVEHPCLTLGLAVQPQVLEQAGASEAAEGRGFFARFLFSYPQSRVGGRLMRHRPSLDQGLTTVEETLLAIDTLIKGNCEDFEDVSPRSHFSLSSLSLSSQSTT